MNFYDSIGKLNWNNSWNIDNIAESNFRDVSIYLVYKGAHIKLRITRDEDGFFTISKYAKEEFDLHGNLRMFDKNGCQIFIEDFSHLQNDDCIYICARKRDFNYRELLDMYIKVSLYSNLYLGWKAWWRRIWPSVSFKT